MTRDYEKKLRNAHHEKCRSFKACAGCDLKDDEGKMHESCLSAFFYEQGRTDSLKNFITDFETDLSTYMPADKVKYIIYRAHRIIEQLKGVF